MVRRVNSTADLSKVCRRTKVMGPATIRRLIALVHRSAERLYEADRVGMGQSADIQIKILYTTHHLLFLCIQSIASTLTFDIATYVSQSGRRYRGIVPRPVNMPRTVRNTSTRHVHTDPFLRSITTTDLSQLGRRRLCSRIRAEAAKVVEKLEGEEEVVWTKIAPLVHKPKTL